MKSSLSKKITITAISTLAIFLSSCDNRFAPGDPSGGNFNNGPVAVLAIRVIDEVTGRPIPNATVTLKKDQQTVAEGATTDQNGLAAFQNIPVGDGYKAVITRVIAYKASESDLIQIDGTSEKTVLLKRLSDGEGSGLIVGSVKEIQSNLPIKGLRVSISSRNGLKVKPIFTNEVGSFSLDGLLPGTYVVDFVKSGYRSAQKSVTVREGESASIETLFLNKEKSFGSAGNTLISLNGSGRVIELDKSGRIIWNYNKLRGVESSVRLFSGTTLIADGTAGRVLQVNGSGHIMSTIGSGTLFKSLKRPSWVDSQDGKTILITDNGNNRVTEFINGNPGWSYSSLNRPRSATYLSNGNVLISDTANKRVIEINKKNNQVVWSFNRDMDKPVQALRLANGNTLITDSGFGRVIEVNRRNQVVWWFAGDASNATPIGSSGYEEDGDYSSMGQEAPVSAPGNNLLFPRSAVRLANGNTLIADTGNNRVLEVSRSKRIVWELNNLARPVSIERL